MAVVIVLALEVPRTAPRVAMDLRIFIGQLWDTRLLRNGGMDLAVTELARVILPCLLAAAFVGCAAVLLQTQFLLHLGALEPKLSRVSPMAGLKRVFGIQGVVELCRSIVKLTLILIAVGIVFRREWPSIFSLPRQDPRVIPHSLWGLIFEILIVGLVVQAVVAAMDIFWARFKFARDLRMSKQDIRDEMKDTEGSPLVKGRLRRIRATRARRRMMSKVPTATVVVTNPTHYAVALSYERDKNPAPRIVAKGVDDVAVRIIDLAKANKVPIVPNPPLARALYRLELDTEIPAEHFKAVAEIIAFVWRLRRRA